MSQEKINEPAGKFVASQESIREDYSKLSELSNLIAKYSDNPLMFWADNAANYPVLQQLASLFLGMSAGSVPVECLFSITGQISNSRRSSICPSKLNKISFLHDNLDFIVSNQ